VVNVNVCQSSSDVRSGRGRAPSGSFSDSDGVVDKEQQRGPEHNADGENAHLVSPSSGGPDCRGSVPFEASRAAPTVPLTIDRRTFLFLSAKQLSPRATSRRIKATCGVAGVAGVTRGLARDALILGWRCALPRLLSGVADSIGTPSCVCRRSTRKGRNAHPRLPRTPRATVTEIARKHGVTRWQVYDWRRRFRHGQLALPKSMATMFAPLMVEDASAPQRAAGSSRTPAIAAMVVFTSAGSLGRPSI
jgi:transposase-like protein